MWSIFEARVHRDPGFPEAPRSDDRVPGSGCRTPKLRQTRRLSHPPRGGLASCACRFEFPRRILRPSFMPWLALRGASGGEAIAGSHGGKPCWTSHSARRWEGRVSHISERFSGNSSGEPWRHGRPCVRQIVRDSSADSASSMTGRETGSGRGFREHDSSFPDSPSSARAEVSDSWLRVPPMR